MPSAPKLRIFLSFSGPVSKTVGAALFEWLKTLTPSFAPFMSDRDISAGSWSPQLMKALRTSDACIACVTRENLDAEWIHFEAGAIAMRDQDPDSRLACVIKRYESPELFLSLCGHIGIMDDASHSRSLDDLLLAAGEKP